MNNHYDEKYEIRRAEEKDIENIMNFIDSYWKKEHIFGMNRQFFEYEFCHHGKVNFMIAIDREKQTIEGISGFIFASQSLTKRDIWGVIWKVKETPDRIPGLGLELKKRVKLMLTYRANPGVGLNPQTAIPIQRKKLGYYTNKMQHFYLLSRKDNYCVADIDNYRINNYQKEEQCQLQHYKNIEEVEKSFSFEEVESIPYKDIWYINHRYFEHPIYRYDVCGIISQYEQCQAILVLREVGYRNVKILKIIDYIGQQKYFATLGQVMNEKLRDYEYIDFYCDGFEKQYILDAGFVERTETDRNIIPNYFEPYEKNNVDIWVSSSVPNCLFVRGDGDQDRPSIILNSN